MKIEMAPMAYWHLQWLCQRTENEVSAMGILSSEAEGFRIEEIVLVKQEVSPCTVDLDMEWWADKQVDLFERQHIQPWQNSCWIHTHPKGVKSPSKTDEDTMETSFGSWPFVLMLILTKCGHFYARVDFNHEFPTGNKVRFSFPCDVEVDWVHSREIPPGYLQAWEEEFKELVQGEEIAWFEDEDIFDGKEDEYEELCDRHGLDPYDPTSFEAVFGYWPSPGDLEFAGI